MWHMLRAVKAVMFVCLVGNYSQGGTEMVEAGHSVMSSISKPEHDVVHVGVPRVGAASGSPERIVGDGKSDSVTIL